MWGYSYFMTYAPSGLTHYEVDGQRWCSPDTRYCTEADPCPCCAPAAAVPLATVKGEASAPEVEGEVTVRHVADSDAGAAGEAHSAG